MTRCYWLRVVQKSTIERNYDNSIAMSMVLWLCRLRDVAGAW